MPENHEQSNKQALTRMVDAANSHDDKLIGETVDAVFQPDATSGSPLPIAATGAQQVKEVYARLHRAFPDLHIAVEDMIAEGDKVVSRHTVTGTHRGEYMGVPPTGRSVTYSEIFIFRFVDGRIAEAWGVVDVLAQMKQLGAIPERP
jgi:steroid delta-isomerase-like uncharacterized protein